MADEIDGHYGQTRSPNTHLSLPHVLSSPPVGELGVDADVEPGEEREGDDCDQEDVQHHPDLTRTRLERL